MHERSRFCDNVKVFPTTQIDKGDQIAVILRIAAEIEYLIVRSNDVVPPGNIEGHHIRVGCAEFL